MQTYTISVIDHRGLSYYDEIQVCEVVDLGDTYNLITTKGDMFLEKDFTHIVVEKGIVRRVEYVAPNINLTVTDQDDILFCVGE